MKKVTQLLIIFVVGIFWQCSLLNKKEEDKTPQQAALFLLLQEKTCKVGEEIFVIKEGNVSCSSDTIEGTGLLLSTKEKEVPSIEANITFNGDDSEFIFYGASDGDLKKNGSGFRFANNIAKAFHPDGTPGGVDMGGSFAFTSSKTVCLEIHSKETPPHLVGWEKDCSTSSSSFSNNPDYNSRDPNPGGTSAKKGDKWGIELKNAKVVLKVNSEEIFSHE